MQDRIEDRNLTELAPLTPPRELKERLPVTERAGSVVLRARAAIRDVIHGRDPDRLVVVVGPCSIHDREAALEYAGRLARLAEDLEHELVIAMRTYFEKPRTTLGWKGLINDPRLDGSCDVAAGLWLARDLLLEINELGLPCATEYLDPFTPQYLGDLLCWAAIGARTAESPTHRQLASGLSCPVGIKNPTDGRLEVARNALLAAAHPHTFLGITPEGAAAVVRTAGNPDRHVVLRGGASGPNYDADSVARAVALLADQDLPRAAMVDCSHDNSGKDPARQAAVCRAVLEQVCARNRGVMGLLIESHLEGGRQSWEPGADLAYGVSITDGCIGWDETEDLLRQAAEAVKVSR